MDSQHDRAIVVRVQWRNVIAHRFSHQGESSEDRGRTCGRGSCQVTVQSEVPWAVDGEWALWILVTASALHVVEEQVLGWQG